MDQGDSPEERRVLVQFGKTLIERSAQKKKSLERLAYEAGVAKGYIYEIAKGRRNPSLLILYRIASALDISIWKLVKPL